MRDTVCSEARRRRDLPKLCTIKPNEGESKRANRGREEEGNKKRERERKVSLKKERKLKRESKI